MQAGELPFETVISVSARTGDGLAALSDYISREFSAGAPADGSLLTNARQTGCVRRADAALSRAMDALALGMTPDAVLTDVEDAMAALGELTGRSVSSDVTARIFERFCVGK